MLMNKAREKLRGYLLDVHGSKVGKGYEVREITGSGHTGPEEGLRTWAFPRYREGRGF